MSKVIIEEAVELELDFSKIKQIAGLNQAVIPTVIQDMESKEVILIGYTNQESLEYTLTNKLAALWSTSRNELWIKGKTSGQYLDLVDGEHVYNTHTGPTNAEDLSVSYAQFEFVPSSTISINMNVNNWYNDPVYNMVVFGNAIMGNLDAQELLSQNGENVFSIQLE